MSRAQEPFFVGFYKKPPKKLRPFLITVALLMVAGFAVMAFAVGGTQDDPGEGAFRFDYGRQTVTGVLELKPYPILHVTEGNERIKPGETLMLSGTGKFGVEERAQPFDGQQVQVTGIVIQRGTINMFQVLGRRNALSEAEGAGTVPEATDLGRWKLTGEICDGKCVAGAMRPGRGIAHKACANLCLLGGVPPVFVTTQPVEGHEFLMIGRESGELSPEVLSNVGAYVSVEGHVEQRGSLLVFLIDDDTFEVLP